MTIISVASVFAKLWSPHTSHKITIFHHLCSPSNETTLKVCFLLAWSLTNATKGSWNSDTHMLDTPSPTFSHLPKNSYFTSHSCWQYRPKPKDSWCRSITSIWAIECSTILHHRLHHTCSVDLYIWFTSYKFY